MSTTVTTRTIGQAAEPSAKHRACDECRTRKLACSKEPDGCSRCRREGIPCHYSPQKPMGRPRKRPRDESNNEDTAVAPATENTMTEIPQDTADPGLALINILTGGEGDYDMLGNGSLLSSSSSKGYSWDFGYTGDSLGDIGFDPVPQHAPLFSPSNIDPSLFVSAAEPPGVEQVPNLSPNSASTPENVGGSCSAPPPQTPPAINCAHTAALYLALDSMQKVPEGVENGIRHARRASRTAYDVVYCPVCSFRIEPPDRAASSDIMRNFQNLMMLATLIPTIVHAYENILRVVDEETTKAVAERRRLIFKLKGFGGIMWGDENTCSNGSETLNHLEMEPAMWRLTVRALLKADVYGLSGLDCDITATSPLHIGLKDIVLQMEQKSKTRHAVLDAMVHSGAWQLPNCGLGMHNEGETPTCQRVIAIAKASIDQLIIA